MTAEKLKDRYPKLWEEVHDGMMFAFAETGLKKKEKEKHAHNAAFLACAALHKRLTNFI